MIANKKRGASRFQSLLQKLGLEDRLVSEPSEISIELLSKPLAESSFAKLKDLQNNSEKFLLRNLV